MFRREAQGGVALDVKVARQLGLDGLAGDVEVGVDVAADPDCMEQSRRPGVGVACDACLQIDEMRSNTHYDLIDPARAHPIKKAWRRRDSEGRRGFESQTVRRQPQGEKVHAWGADESGGEAVHWVVEQRSWRARLDDFSTLHQHDPIGQRHCFPLVVSDMNRGHAELFLELAQLPAHLLAILLLHPR